MRMASWRWPRAVLALLGRIPGDRSLDPGYHPVRLGLVRRLLAAYS
jgi:hypothetical protein